jgi:DNA-directed RNA polymerase specialized sigma24 family protein
MTGEGPPSRTHRERVIASLERQCDGLLAIAMRLTGWDRARSEDLVQTAFWRALNARAGAASWTYLRRALMSAFLDDEQSAWRRLITTTDKLREIPQEDPIVERLHHGRVTHGLKDQLPEREYLTLVMWAEGYSAKETCRHLGLPRSTYAHVLARAKQAAQEWLDRHDPSRPASPSPRPSVTGMTK